MATPIKVTPTLQNKSSVRFQRELNNNRDTNITRENKARIDSLVSKVLAKSKISR